MEDEIVSEEPSRTGLDEESVRLTAYFLWEQEGRPAQSLLSFGIARKRSTDGLHKPAKT
jgi:hypothetical protein